MALKYQQYLPKLIITSAPLESFVDDDGSLIITRGRADPRSHARLPICSVWPQFIESQGLVIQKASGLFLLGGQRPGTPCPFTFDQIDKCQRQLRFSAFDSQIGQ